MTHAAPSTRPPSSLGRTLLGRTLLGGLVALLVACSGGSDDGTGDGSGEADVREVEATEVVALGSDAEGVVLLDVRSPAEYAAGHVPGAVNIPVGDLGDRLAELEDARDDEIIVYCEKGGRAATAADALLEAGFAKVGHLVGDMSAWRDAGHPVD